MCVAICGLCREHVPRFLFCSGLRPEWAALSCIGLPDLCLCRTPGVSRLLREFYINMHTWTSMPLIWDPKTHHEHHQHQCCGAPMCPMCSLLSLYCTCEPGPRRHWRVKALFMKITLGDTQALDSGRTCCKLPILETACAQPFQTRLRAYSTSCKLELGG